MKLENRVVSEELAKKMSDLAISNLDEPLFWWEVFTDDGDSHIRTHDQMIKRIKTQAKVEMYPAFTEAELLDKLPQGYYICEKNLWYKGKNIEIDHIDNDLNKPLNYVDAFAKLLIWLKEQGKVKL